MANKYSLQKLIPAYRELNTIYKNIVEKQQMSLADQKRITKFYSQNNDKRLFEQMVIKSLQQMDKAVFLKASTVLKELLTENIDYYNVHSIFLLKIDTIGLCQEEEKRYEAILEKQHESVKYYNDQLKDLEGSYESASWKNEKEKISTIEKKIEKLKPLYDKEKKGLDEVYTRKNNLQKELAGFSTNIFNNIFSLSKCYMGILTLYAETEGVADTNSNTILSAINQRENIIYFDMGLIAKVYGMCNKNQFTGVDEIVFFNFFNLRASHGIKIKEHEKTRAYYLLHRMSEILEGEQKKMWLESILTNLAIKRSDYDSKYRHCISAMPGRKNAEFAKDLDTLFNIL